MTEPKLRKGETPGGGFIVIGRVHHGTLEKTVHKRPMEHPDLAAAEKERKRLADKDTDKTFEIWAKI